MIKVRTSVYNNSPLREGKGKTEGYKEREST